MPNRLAKWWNVNGFHPAWLWRRREYCYCCRAHRDRLRMKQHPRIPCEWVCRFCWRLTDGKF